MPINPIHGTFGDDKILTTAGADRVQGGAGNDQFIFNAGQLAATTAYGALDHILDFRGAGTSGSGEQDQLVFKGFSAGSSLVFDHFGADRVWDDGLGAYKLVENKKLQYYKVVDPVNPANSGYIMVQTSSDNTLTAADVLFESLFKDLVIDFEDIVPDDYLESGTYSEFLRYDYKGFTWKTISEGVWVLDGSQIESGWINGYKVNGTNLAYNAYAEKPVRVTQTDGSDFIFEGMDILAAWDTTADITIQGLLDGLLVGTHTLAVTNTAVSHIDVSWGMIDELVITTTGAWMVMDNFHFQV